MKRNLTIKLREVISKLLHEPPLPPTDPPLDPTDPPPTESSPTDPPLDPTVCNFKEDELPFDMAVGYSHPSVKGLTIFALADFLMALRR